MHIDINYKTADVAKAISDWKKAVADEETIDGYTEWVNENRFRYCYHHVDWTQLRNSESALFGECIRCKQACEISIEPVINAVVWAE